PEIKSITKTSSNQLIKKQEGDKKAESRRIAQLVVWTKNPGKDLEKDLVSAAPVPIPVNTGNASSSEGNLFFVQYPLRGASDASKAKGKAPKRLRKSPCKKSHRKSAHKKKSTVQGSTAGRAYRTYLHTCLEKQRQQFQIVSDFKVEKLFQPDRGVALPGEILTTSSAISSSCAPVDPPVVQPASSGLGSDKDNIITTFPFTTPPPPLINQHITPKLTDSNDICSAANSGGGDIDTVTGNNDRAGTGSGEVTIFELPESFTVSTDTANEFDLLIQNVVHEEMVDVDEDEDLIDGKHENCNKRMRMSTGTSSVSSEDSMSIYESGKPRCTYTELIEKALTESGGLTVSEIYTWISDRYPFFKPDDDRWKNSVRHNLSINPYFKKGEKARSGAGHLWTISEKSKGLRPSSMSFTLHLLLTNDIATAFQRRKSSCDPLEIDMPME
ncbi:Forkhead box protein J2, partial [Orchesella cincta]